MKRSEINRLMSDAEACFIAHGWALPPTPKWDVTDFGLGDWQRHGLVLINLADEPEYCEKLMYARRGMVTPAHCHRRKKEDIVCRWGVLRIQIWSGRPDASEGAAMVSVNGEPRWFEPGERIELRAGERVTLVPGVYHAFEPGSDECIIGEVSTANDDLHDNYFFSDEVGRFTKIEEDEPPRATLIGE